MPYTGPILLTGDMIASVTSANQVSNLDQPGFGMNLCGVRALDNAQATYRLVWSQNVNAPDTTDEFQNGQIWRLEQYCGSASPSTDTSAQSWTSVPGYDCLGPRDDLVSGVGAGDDYVLFQGAGGLVLYDINGGLHDTPRDMFYDGSAAAQNGDPQAGDNDSQLDFADARAAYSRAVCCFCAGTLIDTARGPVAVEALVQGDLLTTLDHGLQPVRWIGRREVALAETVAHPELLPVRVAAGAMGEGLPQRDLWLSPQHRVLVRSPVAQRMSGAAEALVAVRHLDGLPGIEQFRTPRTVSYLHLRLDRHEVIRAEGPWAETLLTGREALRSIGPVARRELRLLLPAICETAAEAARPILPGRLARRLAQRHTQNAKPLLQRH